MTSPQLLGSLSAIHELLKQLVEEMPEKDVNHQFHPQLGSLAWYLGHSVYQELYWLREVVGKDGDLSTRVEQLFTPGKLSLTEQCTQLPSKDHILNWAAEIQDEHLRRLANPGGMPDNPLLENDRLVWFLLQEHCLDYEYMLSTLTQRSKQIENPDYRVHSPLRASPPKAETGELTQGHYRIGAREEPAAYDNELPPQAVELSSFRIAHRPVSNSEYLDFMEAGGYQEQRLWTTEGWIWNQHRSGNHHPQHWRTDKVGNWYGIGVNGANDLAPDMPVMGVSQHEAKAYCNWAASLGEGLSGAILPHEYQWELAARSGILQQRGQVWEWCSRPFHPYPDFTPFPSKTTSQQYINDQHWSLRGGCIHSQRVLRRASYRRHAPPTQRLLFTGMRLVFPPD